RAAAATFSSSAYRLVSFLARPASAWTAGSESSSCTRACSSSRTLTLAVRVSSAISAVVGRGLRQGCRLLDLHEELDVRARLLELGHEQFDGLLLFEAGQQPTQLPHHLRLFGGREHLFATGARGVDVDGREDALVRELAAQAQLHIAGSLELLEDDLVHLRSGLDQRRGEDGQRTAALDVACGTEELLRRVQRVGVDTTGEDAAGGRLGDVVGTPEAGDVVKQDDDVRAHLDQALGALDGEFGDRRVIVGGPIEGRGDDLALDGTLHVRDFLGTFVDEDDHEVRFGIVLGDRIRDLLHDRGLTGLRGRDDETALALADGRDEVDQTRRVQLRGGLQPQALLRVERGELRELHAAASIVDGQSVDGVEADECVELLALAAPVFVLTRLADRAGDGIALAQSVLPHHRGRDVDVVRAREITGSAQERIVVMDVENAPDGNEHVVVADVRLVIAATATLAVPTASAPIAAVVIVVAAIAPTAAVTVVAVVPAAVVAVIAVRAVIASAAAIVTAAVIAAAVVTAGPVVTAGAGPVVSAPVAAVAVGVAATLVMTAPVVIGAVAVLGATIAVTASAAIAVGAAVLAAAAFGRIVRLLFTALGRGLGAARTRAAATGLLAVLIAVPVLGRGSLRLLGSGLLPSRSVGAGFDDEGRLL